MTNARLPDFPAVLLSMLVPMALAVVIPWGPQTAAQVVLPPTLSPTPVPIPTPTPYNLGLGWPDHPVYLPSVYRAAPLFATLTVEPAASSIAAGGIVEIAVRAYGLQYITGMALVLRFERGALQVIDGDPAMPGTQALQGDIFEPVPMRIVDNYMDGDRLYFAWQYTEPGESVNGDGSIITFRARGRLPGETWIDFGYTEAVDVASVPLTPRVRGATVVVAPFPDPTRTGPQTAAQQEVTR